MSLFANVWGEISQLLAPSDYSSYQYYMMKMSSTAKTIGLCGAGEGGLGILMNKPDLAGKAAQICVAGVYPAIYGNTVTAGNWLMSDASGKLVPHTGTNVRVALALEGGSANEIHPVLMASGATAGASVNYGAWCFHINMTLIADGDLITNFVPGFAGTITKLFWIQESPVTTASKGSTINLEIGSTNLNGGVLTLTSALCTPLGKYIAATAITDDNEFGASDTISVEASSTTTFIEGKGTLVIEYSC